MCSKQKFIQINQLKTHRNPQNHEIEPFNKKTF